jgi:hypothetical protein
MGCWIRISAQQEEDHYCPFLHNGFVWLSLLINMLNDLLLLLLLHIIMPNERLLLLLLHIIMHTYHHHAQATAIHLNSGRGDKRDDRGTAVSILKRAAKMSQSPM